MESLESRGYTIQDQLSKGQYTSVLAAYSTLHHSKVAVKLLPPIDVKCTLVRNAALGGEWIVDLPSEVTRLVHSLNLIISASGYCDYARLLVGLWAGA